MSKIIVSTKHMSTLAWLQSQFPELMAGAEVNPYVGRRDVGPADVVIGTLPVHIISACRDYFTVEFSGKHAGNLNSVQDLIDAGAYLQRVSLLTDDMLVRLVANILNDIVSGRKPPPPEEALAYAREVLERSKA